MNIIGLNSNFQIVKYLKVISLQWNRKYYQCGDFTLYMSPEEWSDEIKYISRNNREEIGIVQKVLYQKKTDGDFLTIYGFFLEHLLEQKVVYPDYFSFWAKNIVTICQELVTTYKDNDLIILDSSQSSMGENISKQETDGGMLGTTLYNTLKPQELSNKLRWNGTNYIYTIWQGLDRTQSQSVNNPVILSTGFKNIKNINHSTDESNYRNYAYVEGMYRLFGEGYDYTQEYTELREIDQREPGEEKRSIYVNSGIVLDNPAMGGIIFLRESLDQVGKETLSKYPKITNLEFDIDTTRLKYLTDFDLGDKCDIILEEKGLSYESRIIEIYEVYQNNTEEISLVMGDKIPTQYEKARLK